MCLVDVLCIRFATQFGIGFQVVDCSTDLIDQIGDGKLQVLKSIWYRLQFVGRKIMDKNIVI